MEGKFAERWRHNDTIRPLAGVEPFYSLLRPEFPERIEPAAMQVHGIPLERLMAAPRAQDVAERLIEWFAALGLSLEGRLIPLAHNWAFEANVLNHWLGPARSGVFHGHSRCSFQVAAAINDGCRLAGKPVAFASLALTALAEQFGITSSHPHDALCDALVGAEVYRELVAKFNFATGLSPVHKPVSVSAVAT